MERTTIVRLRGQLERLDSRIQALKERLEFVPDGGRRIAMVLGLQDLEAKRHDVSHQIRMLEVGNDKVPKPNFR